MTIFQIFCSTRNHNTSLIFFLPTSLRSEGSWRPRLVLVVVLSRKYGKPGVSTTVSIFDASKQYFVSEKGIILR